MKMHFVKGEGMRGKGNTRAPSPGRGRVGERALLPSPEGMQR